MTDIEGSVWVTIAVNVGGETKTFTAEATTAGDPYDIANGLLSGLDNEAGRWLYRAGTEARRGY